MSWLGFMKSADRDRERYLEEKLRDLCNKLGTSFTVFLESKLRELEYRRRVALITNQAFFLRGRHKIRNFIQKVLRKPSTNDLVLGKELNENRWRKGTIPRHVREYIRSRDDDRCQVCGGRLGKGSGEVDHKIPVIYGGATSTDNLWLLCDECNEGKREFPHDYLGTPWLLEGKSSRLRYCVIMRDGRRCRLCGRTYMETQLEVYSRMLEAEGGRWTYDHLWTLCTDCAHKPNCA